MILRCGLNLSGCGGGHFEAEVIEAQMLTCEGSDRIGVVANDNSATNAAQRLLYKIKLLEKRRELLSHWLTQAAELYLMQSKGCGGSKFLNVFVTKFLPPYLWPYPRICFIQYS